MTNIVKKAVDDMRWFDVYADVKIRVPARSKEEAAMIAFSKLQGIDEDPIVTEIKEREHVWRKNGSQTESCNFRS